MQSNVFINVLLPIALGFIMFGMGLSLTINDFKRIFVYPKAVTVGLIGQLVVVPLFGFVIASLFLNYSPVFAVGLMLAAVCVGGTSSTLVIYLTGGDVPLSITLSAFTNAITVITIPFMVNLSLQHFMGGAQAVQLPILESTLLLILLTIIPPALGVALNTRFPEFAKKADKPTKIASMVAVVLIMVGSTIANWEALKTGFTTVGITVILYNIGLMAIGYGLGRLSSLPHTQRLCLALEFGIQNGILAINIASLPNMLNNPTMSIPPLIYGYIMILSSLIFGWVVNRLFRKPALVEAPAPA